MRVLLMGNPNVGKSALFYHLTGVAVKTSNYAGTTVTFTEGKWRLPPENCDIRTANEKYSVSGLTDYISGDINAREYLALAGGGPFDAIVCFETLEHVRDPQLFLYDLRRLVRSGGYLVLSVPDGKYEPLDREGAIKSSYHLHAFSEEQVGQMLGAAGFRVQQRMYQPDSAGLHRNEFRAIRDTGATRETAERCYNKSPEAARYLAQVYAWPRKERGESYSNIFVSLNE